MVWGLPKEPKGYPRDECDFADACTENFLLMSMSSFIYATIRVYSNEYFLHYQNHVAQSNLYMYFMPDIHYSILSIFFMVLWNMNIHIISCIKSFSTILACVCKHPRKMNIFHMLASTTFITVYLSTDFTFISSWSIIWAFLQILTYHGLGIVEV